MEAAALLCRPSLALLSLTLLASCAASPERVHMVGIRAGEDGFVHLGSYTKQTNTISERPTYLKEGSGSSSIWHVGGTWFVGRTERLGQRLGSLAVTDAAASPDLVKATWYRAMLTNFTHRRWERIGSLRCLSGDAGEREAEQERKSAQERFDGVATSVYLVGTSGGGAKLAALRRDWLGKYTRRRTGTMVNGRHTYTKEGSASRMLWFAGSAWFVGLNTHVGKPVGVFVASDEAISPEQIGTTWRAAAGQLSTKGVGWIDAPDIRVLTGAEGRNALDRFRVERSIAAARAEGARSGGGGGRGRRRVAH